jgi:hypothetical protein
VTISDTNRKRFEGIGLEAIRRELTIGNNFYLPIDPVMHVEAQEWVAEREREILEVELAGMSREKRILKYTLWTLLAAIAAVVVGIVAVVVTLMH